MIQGERVVILLLRALARVLAFLLFVALAAAGLAVALFSLGSGAGDFSLPGLARLIGLPELREEVGTLLARVEAEGDTALVTALAAVGAVVLGVCLILGALWPRRERLVVFDRDEQGRLAARRRVLASLAGALAEQPRGVTEAKVRVRPGRRTGGVLSVRAFHSRRQQGSEGAQPRGDRAGSAYRGARVTGPGTSSPGRSRQEGRVMLRQRLRFRRSPLVSMSDMP